MKKAIRKRIRVGADGVIKLQDASLPEGATAEVIVLFDHDVPPRAAAPPLADLVGRAPGVHVSAEAADQHLEDLRGEWD